MCPSHYAANVSAFLLILFLSPRSFVDVPMTFLQLTTKAEPPFAMRHSCLEIAPERNQQLACDGDDPRARQSNVKLFIEGLRKAGLPE